MKIAGYLFWGWSFGLVFALGCSSVTTRENTFRTAQETEKRPLVDDSYSLASDRQKLEEIRKDETKEKRHENDEEAFMLELFKDPQKTPSEVREKFDSFLRKKREIFDRDLRKERDQFTNEERKKRDTFLKDAEDTRKDFLSRKPNRDDKARFFSDQDDKRREFFANQREKRNDFESDVQERRKGFEDYTKERRNRFNDDYRAYVKAYDERRRATQVLKKTEAETLNHEIEEAKSIHGYFLDPGE